MDREKLIAKIRALTAKTAASGCTEAEAMAAAAKAAELMREYGVSEEMLDVGQAKLSVKQNLKSLRAPLWATIADCTNCHLLTREELSGRSAIYVGIEPGPEIACYLHDVTNRAIDTALAEFRKGKFYKARRSTKTKRKAVDDFTAGMALSLRSRLIDLFGDMRSAKKREIARAVFDQLFPTTKTVNLKSNKTRFDDAANVGWAAGRRVNISHGVAEGERLALPKGGE